MNIPFSRWAAWATATVWLVPSLALADARVTTIDDRPWAEVVAAFESDVASRGGTTALCVRDETSPACRPCASYTLAFDEAGTRAFAVGACDPATGATQVTLVDRDALFDTTHPVTRPRTITIRAVIVSAIEASGGAASTGGSALSCLARVRPYLHDLRAGTDVYLLPRDYEVRVREVGVEVSTFGDGWMLVSAAHIESEVAYDVVERGNGEIVMTGHASRECASDTLTTIDPGVASTARGAFDGGEVPHVRGAGFGSLPIVSGRSGGDVSNVGGCVGFYPIGFQHSVQIDEPVAGLRIRVEGGSADLTLAVHTSDGQWSCNDDGGASPHVRDPIVALDHPPIGRVEIWVGAFGAPHDVTYRMQVHEGTTTPPFDGVGARHLVAATRSFVTTGAVTSAFSWCFMAVFDVFPGLAGSGTPSDAWRDLAWIPIVGPWIADATAGVTPDFDGTSELDAVFQDIGFLSFLLGFFTHEGRQTSIALSDRPDAPRLALGGSSGSAVGATLTF